MFQRIFLLFHFVLTGTFLFAQTNYVPGPNSSEYPGIPKGKVSKFTLESKTYPGTTRAYYLYVPAQYNGQSAALMVFQDGHAYVNNEGEYKVPVVFDNLIAQGKMPVTIGLFVNPGHGMDKDSISNPFRASNRSVEYDEVSGLYGEMIINELIPALKKEFNISDDPDMHAIAGLSSGAICAFSAAWFHNEYFHKVMSHFGSFTDIRGGHNYPSMIRKEPKKNIKMYMQDGTADLDNQFGNWWLANLQMEAALKFRNYEYTFDKGDGGHNGKHAGSILPQSLEWLWSDQVTTGIPSGVFSFPEKFEGKHVFYDGHTVHFKEMELSTQKLTPSSIALTNAQKEQMVIIKEGQVEVDLNGKKQNVGPGSVVFVLAGDKISIRSPKGDGVIYQMVYKSRKDPVKTENDVSPSFVKDFSTIEFVKHDRGGIRNYFRTSTPMCPYYEMHMTNLNGGIKSHEPHTHKAAEIVLMVEGNTEMEIGNETVVAKPGDIYFLESNVPHAIKNVGDTQARYFAYQWD
ncbi:MAG: cupin domain-containing protein [Saprospiraceae bacterium]|nr:cupin domain-containing protein [Saprospiraceae bacterium]